MSKIIFQNNKMLTLGGCLIIPVQGTGPAPLYTITIGTSSHGSVTASALSASAGTTITLTATPDTDYQLSYFTVNGIAIVGNSFVMPNANVTVAAVFVAAPPTFDTVTIGTQTWMAKNLAIDDGGDGIYSYTVNYGQGDVTEHYYTWIAATRIAASIDGWRLPTWAEFETLRSTVGTNPGTKLKSTYGWSSGNGTDDYGFSAFPNGEWYEGTVYDVGNMTLFWTSTTASLGTNAYLAILDTSSGLSQASAPLYATESVRLIQDT